MSLLNKLFPNKKSFDNNNNAVSTPAPAPKQQITVKAPEQPENPALIETSSSRIYYPDRERNEPVEVENVTLTEKEAVEQGWSFRKKQKRIRITNYHGTEKDIIIPSKIGDMVVNEIGSKAFRNKKIDSVQIPSTIYRVREGAFRLSDIKSVTFAEGTKFIEDDAFYECKNLNAVHLPNTLFILGKSAFAICRSLKYVIIPSYIRKIGERAFFASGLEGFSSCNRYCLTDGSIFTNTPIHNKYKMIVTYDAYDDMHVLLVGAKADVKFRKGARVCLMKNAVPNSCILDFSECSEVSCNDSYTEHRDYWGLLDQFIGGCKVIVPNKINYLYFSEYIDVRYPDGSKYIGYPEIVKKDSNDTQIVVHSYNGSNKIHSWSVNTHSENIKITGDHYYTFDNYAINEINLKTIDLGQDNALGEVFSPHCRNLREVHYTDSEKVRVTRYIPPAELVGTHIHQKLLTAFTCTYTDNNRYAFFDSSVIYDIFSKKYIEYGISSKNYAKHGIWLRENNIHRISQQSKIFIAIDVLRSSVCSHDMDTKIYNEYLRTHKRYAKIVCDKVKNTYPEYAEFLETAYDN